MSNHIKLTVKSKTAKFNFLLTVFSLAVNSLLAQEPRREFVIEQESPPDRKPLSISETKGRAKIVIHSSIRDLYFQLENGDSLPVLSDKHATWHISLDGGKRYKILVKDSCNKFNPGIYSFYIDSSDVMYFNISSDRPLNTDIKHDPIQTAAAGTKLHFVAQLADSTMTIAVRLFYREKETNSFKKTKMKRMLTSNYETEIDLPRNSTEYSIEYYLVAGDTPCDRAYWRTAADPQQIRVQSNIVQPSARAPSDTTDSGSEIKSTNRGRWYKNKWLLGGSAAAVIAGVIFWPPPPPPGPSPNEKLPDPPGRP